jgi:hypothetical protein
VSLLSSTPTNHSVSNVTDNLEWLRFIATIVTPFAVFGLGVLSISRREIIKTLDGKINELRTDFDMHRKECDQGARAILIQMAEYPRREELHAAVSDLKADFRAVQRDRNR